MTVVKNVLNRIHVQRLLFAAALLGVSLSANANFIARTTHGNFEVVRNGKTTELRPPQTVMGNGNAVASTGTVTQGMGATAGGATAASGVNMAGTATVPVNGAAVPVAVKTNVGSDILLPAAIAGLGCVQGGVVGVLTCAAVGGAVAAAPLAYNWVTSSGGRINPQTGTLERQTEGGGYTLKWYYENNTEPYYDSAQDACRGPNRPTRTSLPINDTTAQCRDGGYDTGRAFLAPVCPAAPGSGVRFGYRLRGSTPCGPAEWIPTSMSDIAPYMNKTPVNPGIVKELSDLGQDLGNPALQVTGPASVAGPASSTTTNNTTNNTSSTVTTNTTNNYTYEGNKVTNIGTSITSTTTTKAADGTVTTTATGTTTTTPGSPVEPPEEKVQCDKYPNSLGCAELDTPDAEIPKDTKNVSFTAEDPFGGGRCPTDVMASFRAIGGQSLKIVDWTTFCSQAVPLRGLVLALASIMAFFIIMPGGVRE